jgi:hypothetical protein
VVLLANQKDTTKHLALRLVFMALDQFPGKIKNIFVAHEKTEIESRFLISQPSKDWEEASLDNTTNHHTIVLYAVYQNKDRKVRYYPVLRAYQLVTASITANYNLWKIIGDFQLYVYPGPQLYHLPFKYGKDDWRKLINLLKQYPELTEQAWAYKNL